MANLGWWQLIVTKQNTRGFTIVELLIVIVVIGILAAITIVAFNGVQNKANDASVQSDVSQMAKQMHAYIAAEGKAPSPTVSAEFIKVGIRPTKSAYGSHYTEASGATYNLLACVDTAAGSDKFAIIAASKSGKLFAYSSDTGNSVSNDPLLARGGLCPRYGITNHDSAWIFHSGNWRSGWIAQ